MSFIMAVASMPYQFIFAHFEHSASDNVSFVDNTHAILITFALVQTNEMPLLELIPQTKVKPKIQIEQR